MVLVAIIVVGVGLVLLIRSLNPRPGTRGSQDDTGMIYSTDTSAPGHHHTPDCGHDTGGDSGDSGGDCGGDCGGDGGGGSD
jgi:hypothetical protein